jgi:hypothetical protein
MRWFSRQTGRGGWSGRAVAQQRPRVSKLGLKRLSDYNSNEMAVEETSQEAKGLNKRATLTKHQLKRESWTTALRRWPAREKTPRIKELLTLAPGDVCR